jgi:hypothetical protein
MGVYPSTSRANSAKGSGRSSARRLCPAARCPGPCACVGCASRAGSGSGSAGRRAERGCHTGRVRSMSAPMVHANIAWSLLSARESKR